MKTTTLRRLPIVLLLALAAPVAQLVHSRPLPPLGPSSPLRQDIQAYVQANVLPTLRQQRQKLEVQLAPADQVALAGYRAQLKELRSQGQSMRFSGQPADAAARPSLSPEQRQQAHVLRTQAREVMWQVSELARKYQTNLEKLAAEIQPQRDRWATDIKAIVAKDATPAQQEFLGRRRDFAAKHGPLRKLLSADAFLLLEPTAPAEAPALGGTSLYPNPAIATTQLQYEVKKTGPVSVELLDAQGQSLRSLLPSTQQDKGTYTQSLDLGDLPKGTYFYKITTKAGSETKRFVKE